MSSFLKQNIIFYFQDLKSKRKKKKRSVGVCAVSTWKICKQYRQYGWVSLARKTKTMKLLFYKTSRELQKPREPECPEPLLSISLSHTDSNTICQNIQLQSSCVSLYLLLLLLVLTLPLAHKSLLAPCFLYHEATRKVFPYVQKNNL